MAQAMIHTEEPWVPEDSFASRLAILRRELGSRMRQDRRPVTRQEAAKLCGLDDGSWSNWENGTKPRDFERVCRKIALATGVSLEWLMRGGELAAVTLWIGRDFHRHPAQLDILEHLDTLTPPALEVV